MRARFVEGKFLLASEATDLELELIDFSRRLVRSTLGDIAFDDSWKVSVYRIQTNVSGKAANVLTVDSTLLDLVNLGDKVFKNNSYESHVTAVDTGANTITVADASGIAISDDIEVKTQGSLLVNPGEAWFEGIPFSMRGGKDQLVSGSNLANGIVVVSGGGTSFITTQDDPDGRGKIITFSDGGTTPTGEYRLVIGAREEVVTNNEDPFIKNANIPESTAQKLRTNYRINIVPESAQDDQPIPYTDSSTDGNLVNWISVIPQAGGNGSEVSRTTITGSENIDGRNLEIIIRNSAVATNPEYPGNPTGNPIPNGTAEQQEFFNGKFLDSFGNEYHLNAVFNDTISGQVVLRIDKEYGQPDPQIVDGEPYQLIKRDIFVTDDVNGNPLGTLWWPIATIDWDSSLLFNHDTLITDLRTVVQESETFQDRTNVKFGLQLTDGGNISYDNSTSTLTWTSAFDIVNPHGPVNLIAAGDAVLIEGASLVYELDLESGGNIEVGQLALNISAGGTTITIDPADLEQVKLGNLIVDSAGDIAYIIAIRDDETAPQLTVSAALTTGAAVVHRDAFASGQAPVSINTFVLATRNNNKIYLGGGLLELEDGETNQIGDGFSTQNQTYMGATSESDDKPQYSSTTYIANDDPLNVASGKLDAAMTSAVSRDNQARTAKLIRGGTWHWVSSTNTLSWSSNAFISIAGLAENVNQLDAVSNTDLDADGKVLYIDLKRTAGASSRPIQNAAVASVTLGDDTYVFARRVGSDVLIGNSFLLKDGEYLELDGALAEINRYMGQLRMESTTNPNEIAIAGADQTLLDGAILSQELSDFVLNFSSATLNFTTGAVTGVTGIAFDAITTIPDGDYVWYGIGMLPDTVGADNRIAAQIQVTKAGSSDPVQGDAPFANILGDKKLGAILVQRSGANAVVVTIRRLGVGAGGAGGGIGDTTDIFETLKNMLMDSLYEFVTPNVFVQDEDDKIDGSATGEYSLVSKTFEMDAAETMVSINMLSDDFLNEAVDIVKIQLAAFWELASLDPSATYEVSRDGGAEYQNMTSEMDRIGETDTFVGTHEFEEESGNTSLSSQAGKTGELQLDTFFQHELAQEFTLTATTVIRELDVDLTIAGSPGGYMIVRLVADDGGGLPSTDTADILAETWVDVTGLSTGTETITIPRTVLTAGTYHIVFATDDTYKSIYSGSDHVKWDISSAGSGAAKYDGATWSVLASTGFLHDLKGYVLDLRIRITASGSYKLTGTGVFYDIQTTGVIGGVKNRQVFTFNSTANPNEFTLTNFYPDPDLLRVYLAETGQVFKAPALTFDGRKVIFPEDSFDNGGIPADMTLIFDQTEGGSFDNSDMNALLLAGNFLGSTDPSIDRSSPGRGPIVRSPDGTLYEITIKDGGTGFDIYEVT